MSNSKNKSFSRPMKSDDSEFVAIRETCLVTSNRWYMGLCCAVGPTSKIFLMALFWRKNWE